MCARARVIFMLQFYLFILLDFIEAMSTPLN